MFELRFFVEVIDESGRIRWWDIREVVLLVFRMKLLWSFLFVIKVNDVKRWIRVDRRS